MEIVNLGIVFCVIVTIIWLGKPLYLGMLAGIFVSILLFRIPFKTAFSILMRQTIETETIDVLLGFYVITFIQCMMEKKGRIAAAEMSFNRLLRNRRINTMISPAILGLLPSAAIMTTCAKMVDNTTKPYLDPAEQTFVACFYRHLPEMFLPTFPAVLLGLTLGKQSASAYIIATIPLLIFASLIVDIIYLKKIPKRMPALLEKWSTRQEVCSIFRNLWPLMSVLLLLIIIGSYLPSYSVPLAGAVIILVNFLVENFKLLDLPQLALNSIEPILLINMYLIMLFKGIISHTGVLLLLPKIFSKFPLPLSLSFALLFFCGTLIAGSQAMIALCMPMVLVAFPTGGLPIFVMVMGIAWAAMQISPTHVCAFVAAEYYKTTIVDLARKGIVPILLFSGICYLYYHLLNLFF